MCYSKRDSIYTDSIKVFYSYSALFYIRGQNLIFMHPSRKWQKTNFQPLSRVNRIHAAEKERTGKSKQGRAESATAKGYRSWSESYMHLFWITSLCVVFTFMGRWTKKQIEEIWPSGIWPKATFWKWVYIYINNFLMSKHEGNLRWICSNYYQPKFVGFTKIENPTLHLYEV